MSVNPRTLVLFAAVSLLSAVGGRPGSGSAFAAGQEATATCQALPAASSPGFETQLETFMAGFCYRAAGWMHDANVRTSDGVHPFVKIWYSPRMWHWITVQRRQGNPPDGAMLVKEQFTGLTAPLSEWTTMVKDSTGSHDGLVLGRSQRSWFHLAAHLHRQLDTMPASRLSQHRLW